MKEALLCVSFGTSVATARESITAVEEALAAQFPRRRFFRAFTSPTIRRILAGRGEVVYSVEEALTQLAAAGVADVLLLPTHLLPGIEYDNITAETERFTSRFSHLTLGRPLLGAEGDILCLTESLAAAYPRQTGERLVLLGHGSDHAANAVYSALQAAFWECGRQDVLVGTVEGWPDFAEVLVHLERGTERAVHLLPLMLVAGDHAQNDMAGDDADSWKSRLAAAGYAVRCTMVGLGLLPAVRELYCRHGREATQE